MKTCRVYVMSIIKKDELRAHGQVDAQIYARHLKHVLFQSNDITYKLYIAKCQSQNGVYKNIKQLTSIETVKKINMNINPKRRPIEAKSTQKY